MLWKVARSFATGSDQDDLHQDLLLALWQSIPAFRGDSQPSTFVYRVIYNHALAWNRRQPRAEVYLKTPVEPATYPSDGDDHIRLEQRLDLMYRVIRELPPVERSLVLMYLDELSYQEISAVLGISESNVGVRLHRVKKQLTERIIEVPRA